jgi:hypothetical protein
VRNQKIYSLLISGLLATVSAAAAQQPTKVPRVETIDKFELAQDGQADRISDSAERLSQS